MGRLRALGCAAVLAAAALAATGCGRKSVPAPQQAPPPPREWPQGRSAPLKITDTLILSVPLQYQRSAITGEHVKRSPFTSPSGNTEAQFDFFLPDFTGYTLENYRNDFDENKVEVVYLHAGDPHEAEPDAPGEYPPNMLKRSLKELLNPDDYKDLYGLRCYQGRVLTDRLTCYGQRDAATGEDILLYTPLPPYAAGVTFPVMKANYFSRRYGGVRIAWRTHAKNLPRWHDIDTQIWKFIDAWNVAKAPGPVEPEGGKPQAGSPEAGKPEAGKPEAGKPEAGKPGAGTPAAKPAGGGS